MTANNQCSSEAAMGDLMANMESGKATPGCIGAHANSFSCPWKGKAAQNTCCARGAGAWGKLDRASHDTVEKVKAEFDRCLR